MTSDPRGHRAISDAFAAWSELADAERAQFAARWKAEHGELAEDLQALIDVDAAAGDFLDSPAAGAVGVAAVDPMLGRHLGVYRVSSAIGSGGMGTVYLAQRADERFEQKVAIKILRAGLDPRGAARFRRERQILARLSHPYIAHLVDGGETDGGDPYLVMEYVEGVPITRHCDAGALTLRQRLALFLKVCDAVHFAHQHLVVHRDIKPANVLVTADGVPKLLDFGIARLMQAASAEEPRTMPLLTPDYASPEQVRGEPSTTASDLYSLGVVLYEMIAGARPYQSVTEGSDIFAIINAVSTEEPRRPSAALRHKADALPVDFEIDAIVLKTLRKAPAERYASVDQLAQDLHRYLAGQPVQACEPSRNYRLRKFAGRHRAALAATALVAASLVTATIVARRQAAIAEAERARAEQRFNDVRQLANAFVFDFDRSLQTLPGATAARRLAIARGLEYLERLATDASDAPLLRELAAGYQRIGEVQGNPFSANLGDVDGAMKSYRRAIELRRRVAALTTPTDDDEAGSASAEQGEADLLWAVGDFDAALRGYQNALIIHTELARRNAQDPDRAYTAARAAYFVGQAQTKLGRFDDALTSYRRAFAGYQSIAIANPDRGEYQRTVAVSAMKIGDCVGRKGDHAAARAEYERGLAAIERLFAASPDTPSYARLRGFMLDRLAWALVNTGELARAHRRAADAVRIAEKAVASDAGDRQARGDRAAFRSTLGEAALLVGRLDEAEQVLALSEDEFAELARTGALTIDQRSQRGVTLRRAGDAARLAGRAGEARDRYRQSLAQLDQQPRDLEYEAELAVVLMRLGEIGGSDRRAFLERSLEVWRLAEQRGVHASPLAPGGVTQIQALLRAAP